MASVLTEATPLASFSPRDNESDHPKRKRVNKKIKIYEQAIRRDMMKMPNLNEENRKWRHALAQKHRDIDEDDIVLPLAESMPKIPIK